LFYPKDSATSAAVLIYCQKSKNSFLARIDLLHYITPQTHTTQQRKEEQEEVAIDSQLLTLGT
jgi:hypothetical protein